MARTVLSQVGMFELTADDRTIGRALLDLGLIERETPQGRRYWSLDDGPLQRIVLPHVSKKAWGKEINGAVAIYAPEFEASWTDRVRHITGNPNAGADELLAIHVANSPRYGEMASFSRIDRRDANLVRTLEVMLDFAALLPTDPPTLVAELASASRPYSGPLVGMHPAHFEAFLFWLLESGFVTVVPDTLRPDVSSDPERFAVQGWS